MSKQIYWPDGTKGSEPKDGFTYWVLDQLWVYDKFKSQWVRVNTVNLQSTDHTETKLELASELSVAANHDFDKCECGSESVGSNIHSNYCPKASTLNV